MINERLMAPGGFTINLLPDTPVIDSLTRWGIIAVTEERIDPAAIGDAGVKAAAVFAGPLWTIDGTTLEGPGPDVYLGVEDDGLFGPVIEATIQWIAETFANAVADLLPAAITAGTITNIGGFAITKDVEYTLPITELRLLCALAGGEYRVNYDFTLDAGTPANLFVTTPATVLVEDGSGSLTLETVPTKLSVRRDSGRLALRVVVIGSGDPAALDIGADNITTSPGWKDAHGNSLVWTYLELAPDLSGGDAADLAGQLQDAMDAERQEIKVDVEAFNLDDFKPGDVVFLWAPKRQVYDAANPTDHGGVTIYPAAIRVVGRTWPVTADHGVYYRGHDGTWLDLSDYVIPEAGGWSVDVGDAPLPLAADGSAIINAVRQARDLTVPNTPTHKNTPWGTSAYQDDNGNTVARIDVEWNNPTNTDGSAITDGDGIIVRWRQASATDWSYLIVAESDIAGEGATLFGLAAGADYHVAVARRDANGNASAFSAYETVTAGNDTSAPSTPTRPTLTDVPLGVQFSHDLKQHSSQVMVLDGSGDGVDSDRTTAITGDIDIRAYLCADDFTPSARKFIAGQWASGEAGGNHRLCIETDGKISVDVAVAAQGLRLDGSNDYAHVASAFDPGISGDFDFRFYGQPDDWTPTSDKVLLALQDQNAPVAAIPAAYDTGNAFTGSSGTNHVIDISAASNDTCVFIVGTGVATSNSWSWPGGWTEVVDYTNSSGNVTIGYRNFWGAGNPTNPTITSTATQTPNWAWVSISFVSAVSVTSTTHSGGVALNPPSHTAAESVTSANDLWLAVSGGRDTGGAPTIQDPASYTRRQNIAGTTLANWIHSRAGTNSATEDPGATSTANMEMGGTATFAVFGINEVPGGYDVTFFLTTDGKLKVQVDDGTTVTSHTSSAAISANETIVDNDTRLWLRVTWEDNVAGSRNIKFYTDSDSAQGSYTQLGTTQTGGVVTPVSTSAKIRIGDDYASGSNFAGFVYEAEFRNGVAGTLKAEPDFNDATEWPNSSDHADAQGRTWNLANGAAITSQQIVHTFTSTAALTATDNVTIIGVRADIDVNNGSGGSTVTFKTSSDYSSWSTLGSAVTKAGTILSPQNITSVFRVGTDGVVAGFAGDIYEVTWRNGIDGSVVANPDFDDPAEWNIDIGPNDDAQANTWTAVGNARIVETGVAGARDIALIEVYGGTTPAPTTKVATVAVDPVTSTATGTAHVERESTATYYVRVKAVDRAGNASGYSAQAAVVPRIVAEAQLADYTTVERIHTNAAGVSVGTAGLVTYLTGTLTVPSWCSTVVIFLSVLVYDLTVTTSQDYQVQAVVGGAGLDVLSKYFTTNTDEWVYTNSWIVTAPGASIDIDVDMKMLTATETVDVIVLDVIALYLK